MESAIQSGDQLLEQSRSQLCNNNFYIPFSDSILRAVSLGKPFCKLNGLIQEAAFGYLGSPVHQEVSINALIDHPAKLQDYYEHYRDGHLVITKADSLEEKILTFYQVCFVMDVSVATLVLASPQWDHLHEFCQQNNNHFLIFGTLINDKYLHHSTIPQIDIFTLVPQFLTDTNEPPEIDIGIQLLKKKKKKNELKK